MNISNILKNEYKEYSPILRFSALKTFFKSKLKKLNY